MTMNDTTPVIDQPVHQPAPNRPTWSKGKIIGAIVVAVAVAATAGVTVAVVDRSSGTGGSAAGANGQFPGGGPGGQNGFGGPGGVRGMGGLAGALHGTIVVAGNGQYVTEEIQTGKVTAISASSITVVSTDNYSRTYVLGSSTSVDNGNDKLSSVATGHTVSVTATVSGDTATVTQLLDQSLQPNGQQAPTN